MIPLINAYILKQLTLPLHHKYSSSNHAFYSACTHMHFVQLDGLHCTYPDVLFLSVWVNVLVKWHGNQKSRLFSSRVWLESMVVCKELALPCPHNSRLMWKWHGWALWLAWTCLFKSCMENNGEYFSGRKASLLPAGMMISYWNSPTGMIGVVDTGYLVYMYVWWIRDKANILFFYTFFCLWQKCPLNFIDIPLSYLLILLKLPFRSLGLVRLLKHF